MICRVEEALEFINKDDRVRRCRRFDLKYEIATEFCRLVETGCSPEEAGRLTKSYVRERRRGSWFLIFSMVGLIVQLLVLWLKNREGEG